MGCRVTGMECIYQFMRLYSDGILRCVVYSSLSSKITVFQT